MLLAMFITPPAAVLIWIAAKLFIKRRKIIVNPLLHDEFAYGMETGPVTVFGELLCEN